VPENGIAPKTPALAWPEILSPSTAPSNSSVSGIGFVIATFQETLLPSTFPLVISADWPSAPCVPLSVPPAVDSEIVAACVPIGVSTEIFHLPSTAIVFSSSGLLCAKRDPNAWQFARQCAEWGTGNTGTALVCASARRWFALIVARTREESHGGFVGSHRYSWRVRLHRKRSHAHSAAPSARRAEGTDRRSSCG